MKQKNLIFCGDREMDYGKKVDLGNVYFKLKVEDVFSITNRGTAAVGRISSGEISSGKKVFITDEFGNIITEAQVQVEFFDSKGFAEKGMNVALVFKDVRIDEINKGNYVVIQ